ncbi:MAG: DNA-3-methyladenine glycosylase I [Geminicoccaceae bacterium]|nr:DNA-3-methyladenine glycosylase I [Geminicoccaceae bacterium]
MMVLEDGLIAGKDGRIRCWWPGSDPFYVAYHDDEWGRPVTDDRRLFEKICLEGFQAGLSWITILRKRENFRSAFHGFDIGAVSRMGPADVERLLQDTGIVRHGGKIRSVINNAQRAMELKREFGSLAHYFWQREPAPAERPARMDLAAAKALARSRQSIEISKDLKKRGWSFVGPTTVYAFMQAMGLVNDHLEGCCIRETCEAARSELSRP